MQRNETSKRNPKRELAGQKTEQLSLLHRGKKPKDTIGKQNKTEIRDRSIGNEEVTEESLQGWVKDMGNRSVPANTPEYPGFLSFSIPLWKPQV